jgi:hypothetical protein
MLTMQEAAPRALDRLRELDLQPGDPQGGG